MTQCDKTITHALQSWSCKTPAHTAIKHACLVMGDVRKRADSQSPSISELLTADPTVGSVGLHLGSNAVLGGAMGALINLIRGESTLQGMRTGAITGLGIGAGGEVGSLAGRGVGSAVGRKTQAEAIGAVGGGLMGNLAGGKLMYDLSQRMPELGKKKRKRKSKKKKK